MKIELETRFDKEKVITEQKLFDEIREKKKLEEQKKLMEERLERLEGKLSETLNSKNFNESSSSE